MATEEEAREAADGEEVQVEAVDLKPVHMQPHLDSKLPAIKIKNMEEITSSTEGTLTISEDQVLVEAPSEVEVHPEHNLNGTASSLNGHVEEKEKMSNEQLHENNDGQEQVKDALDGASTDLSNKINEEEMNGCLTHGEGTAENSSLLKYEKEEEPKGDYQQDSVGVTVDDAAVQEDQLKPDNAVGQTADGLQDQSLEPAKATEDTPSAGMANIADIEVVVDTLAGAQTPLEPNVDDSDAIPDVTDRNTEADEPANADAAVHLGQKGLPEDRSVAEHTDEAIEVEDRDTKHADAMDAEAVQEDKPKCEETDLREEKPEPEHAVESTIDAQEVLDQEPSEDTNGSICEKIEETPQESNMVASEETTSQYDATSRDPAVNIQAQNEESLEEKEDPEAVDTEAAMQQRSLASEEANPEDHVVTTEPISDIEDAKDEGMTNKSSVAFTEAVVQEPTEDIQSVHESEQTETKSTETYEMDEPSDQIHANVGDLAEEDARPEGSKPQMTEIAQELKDIEATETEEITQQDHIASSKELSTEDDSTASKPYNDDLRQSMEQDSVEVKDTETAENHQERNYSTTKDDMVEANNALKSESTADIQLEQEPEAEEMENTDHVEEKETSHEMDAAVQKITQEDNQIASELHGMASLGEASSMEATEAETTPHQSHDDQSEEKTEENITASETQILESQSIEETNGIVSTPAEYTKEDNVETPELSSDTQAENLQSAAVTEDTENVKSDAALHEEAALEEHVQTEASSMQDPELEDTKNAEPVEVEDNMTSCDLPAEEMDKETMKSEAILHENPVPSINELIEDTLPASAPHDDIQPVLVQESVESTKCADTTEYPEEPQQTTGSASDELTPTEEKTISTESACDTQVQNVTAQEINDSEDRKIDEISNINSFSTPEEAAEESNAPRIEQNSDVRIEPTSDIEQEQELDSTEETKGFEAVEDHQQQRALTLEEVTTESESNVDEQQVHEDKATEVQDSEAIKTEETNDIETTEPQITSQQTISTSEKSLQEEIETDDMATTPEPSSDTQTENLQSAEVLEETENVKSDAALDEEAVLEEHIQIEAPAGISPVQDHELEETKNTELVYAEDNMISSHLLDEEDKEAMESKEIPHENPVVSIKELGEDDRLVASTPHGDIQPILEKKSVESMTCTDTTEYPEEPQQITGSASDEFTPTEEKTISTEPACDTQVQNVTALETDDSEDRKCDEISNISSFPTPEEAAEESNAPRIEQTSDVRIEPTSDIEQEQELGSTEETRDIEAVEDHQQQRASTLEEVTIDSESNVDDQQVHEDKATEVKDNEAMEIEEVFKQSNIAAPANSAEETSELGSEPDQPAQQVVLSEDSECSQLSGQSNVLTLEERNAEDSCADEIDPPVDVKQEHKQESVEEIKGINATEAGENFHTSQPDAPIEPIQQVDTEVTKEIKGIEAINDGDISCEQTETAILEDTSPKDNETVPEDHHMESNEQNLRNGSDNAMLVHGTKDEIQTSAEQKDDACDSGEIAFPTHKRENKTDEDVIRNSGEDTLEILNNINQMNAERNTGIEHNSTQMAEEPCGENITHVHDEDIKELLTERDTAEASQAVFGNDPQESQDVTDKDDTIKTDEQTSDDNTRQPGDVAPQPQTCESSVDDETEQMVNLNKQEKEDDNTESQKDELQEDEHKHADEKDDATTKPLVESQNTENGTTSSTEDTDVFQAEQTEAVVTEFLQNEQALHTLDESTTIIVDTKVENIAGTDEGAEEENKPNSVTTLDTDSKLDKKEQEITEKDDIMAKDPTDETIDEITNEENVESANKVNDDALVIQESEKEIVAEVEENKEMQNEDNIVRHDESQAEPEKDETSQLHSHEPCNADTKMDDTTILPRETEEKGENKGFNSICFPPKENNVEQDLHDHKVEDEEQTTTEQNAVTVEAIQQVDSSIADANNDNQASTSKSLPEHETESADDVMQLETEDNALDIIHETISNEKTETSNTEATETETTNEDICDKVAGAQGALSVESLQTLDAVAALKEGSMNEKMEDHKLALPAHPTQDENTPEQGICLEEREREISLSEKPAPTEPESNEIPKEQDEEDMNEPEIGDARTEVEQDLPVSHFLMNLIMGKENSDANGNSEPEAEGKQEEIRDDNSCSKQEESLVSLPAESKVYDTLTFEQEKNDVKYSEETQEVNESSHDLKLHTERSLETDAELNKHGLEIPTYQDISEDKISSELLSEDAAGLDTKMKARDTDILNIELDDKAVDAICQEKMEVSEVTAQMGNGSLKTNLDDITNTKASKEETLGEGQTECESLPEDRSTDAEFEQTHLLTESDLTAATSLPSEADSVQNPVSAKQDKTIESSNTDVTSTPEIQLEREEVNEIGKKQHTATSIGEVAEEHVETPHDNLQKGTTFEATSDEQAPQITEPVSETEIALAHEKEISQSSSSKCMDEEENSNFSIKEVENFQTAAKIQADGPNMQINQHTQDKAADTQSEMEPAKQEESSFQEHQETDAEQNSPKANGEADQKLLGQTETAVKEEGAPKANGEADQNFLGQTETAVKEEGAHETVESHKPTEKMNTNEKIELFDSKAQERDFNVASPKEAPGVEDNFVDVTKPEFSTDEEQSPTADKSNVTDEKTYDEKTKEGEETKNFTDEVKTEARGAGQKSPNKKQSLLSGVGLKVKHQLAKVKKAIVGKPGPTKPESPKA